MTTKGTGLFSGASSPGSCWITLAMLMRQLVPFNYVVPGESVNQLVDISKMLNSTSRLSALAAKMQPEHVVSDRPPTINEFSGAEYRIVNFVADLPLRLEQLVAATDLPPDLSHVVFVLTEFQIADKDTAIANESGECSHEAYKARQHEQVLRRLHRGEHEALPSE